MKNQLNPYPNLDSLEKFRAALETTNFLYYRNKDLAKYDEERVHLVRMQHTAIKNGWCDVMDEHEARLLLCIE